MKKEDLNFQQLDSMVDFRYKKDLFSRLSELNFSFVSEFVFVQYYEQEKSAAQIGEKLHLGKTQVYSWMRAWKFKARQRGGNNKNAKLKDQETINQILSLKGAHTCTVAAEKIGCSTSTILNVWKNKKKGE